MPSGRIEKLIESLIPQQRPIIAFSGIGSPIKTYSASADGATVTQLAPTDSYILTINQNARIAGFVAIVSIRNMTGALTGNRSFRCSIKRNGVVVASQIQQLDDFSTTVGGGVSGLFYYETLGFLAGADIFSNEIFELLVELVDYDATATTVTYDASISLTANAVEAGYRI